jgi:AraC-like DNA-binding protein
MASMFAILFIAFRNKLSQANIYLGGFMVFLFIQILLKFFESTGHNTGAIFTYLLIIPVMLGSLPFLFFYAQKLTIEEFQFNAKKLLHFLPALVVLLINLFTFGRLSLQDMHNLQMGIIDNTDAAALIDIYVMTYKASQYIYDVQAIAYGAIMLFLFNRHKTNIIHRFSFKENISLRWLQVFVVVFIVVAFVEVLLYAYTSYMLGQKTRQSVETALYYISAYDNIVLYLMLFYTLFLGFFGIRQSDVYAYTRRSQKGLSTALLHDKVKPEAVIQNTVEQQPETLIEEVVDTAENEKAKKYSIPEEMKIKIYESIMEIMASKKLYLDRHLTLDDLAAEIRVNKNYLSAVINEKIGKNFYQYINELRIEAAIELLDNSQYNYLSIEGIAQTVGFNSKSVFNPAFKKHTGMTPSEYKRKN